MPELDLHLESLQRHSTKMQNNSNLLGVRLFARDFVHLFCVMQSTVIVVVITKYILIFFLLVNVFNFMELCWDLYAVSGEMCECSVVCLHISDCDWRDPCFIQPFFFLSASLYLKI